MSSRSACLRFGKGFRRSLAKTHVGGFVILSYDTVSAAA